MLRVRSPEVTGPAQQRLDWARQVLRTESEALRTVSDRLDHRFDDAVTLLEECRGAVMVTGMGKAGLVGRKIAATMASTGTRAHFLHPGEAVHGDLGCVARGDVALAFSHSGETAELLQILPSLRGIGASLIGVTSRVGSTLARQSDVAIEYGAIEEACPIGMAPSASCAVMLGIGDALAFVLMRQRSFGREDFGRFHPAGSLGRKLQAVRHVMRTGDRMRVARSDLSVRETFVSVQQPGRRTGAILLVDRNGVLEGLFTDSDLARLFEKRDTSAFDLPISHHMTRRPVMLRVDHQVADALTLLRDRRISEIPVVDDAGAPVGVVDITDLLDLLPEVA